MLIIKKTKKYVLDSDRKKEDRKKKGQHKQERIPEQRKHMEVML